MCDGAHSLCESVLLMNVMFHWSGGQYASFSKIRFRRAVLFDTHIAFLAHSLCFAHTNTARRRHGVAFVGWILVSACLRKRRSINLLAKHDGLQ